MADNEVAPGAEIDWTEDELDAISAVSDENIIEMVRYWRQHASPEFKALLDAGLEDDEL